jgi:hypothetical protein
LKEDRGMLELKRKIDEILAQIDNADPATRKALFAHLDRAVSRLEEAGEEVPPQVRARLDAQAEEEIEAQFDNLPL